MIRALVSLVIALILQAAAAAQDLPRFTYERPVEAASPGPRRLPVDVTLLSAGGPFRVVPQRDRMVAEGGLQDLRLFDASGAQVPYLLVYSHEDPVWRAGRILPIAATKTTSGFEVDFAAAQLMDRVRVEGIPAPFLKRLSLEGSGDRERWTLLQPEGTLFDLPEEGISKADLAFTPGAYRYVRVTWNDASSGRVPAPRRVVARAASPVRTGVESAAGAMFERRPSEAGRSRYHIKLPAPQLPIVALDLDVASPYVHRSAAVTESRFTGSEAAPVTIGRANLVRVLRSGVTADSLRIPLTAPGEPEIDLIIDDGDNPPLDVRKISLVFAELPWIYVDRAAGPIVARYGDRRATAPVYDLEAARASIDLTHVPEGKWGDARALAPAASSTAAAAPTIGAGGLVEGEFRFTRPIVLPGGTSGLMALPLDAGVLSHSQGPQARFADVRILDRQQRQVPYLLERRDEPLAIDLTARPEVPPPAPLRPAQGSNLSIYRLMLPEADLTSATLAVQTSASVFQRTVQVGVIRPADRTHRDAHFDALGSATWRSAGEGTAPPALNLPVGAIPGHELWLIVDEGDNAPLPVSGARILLPSYRVRFFAEPGAPLRLAYGRDDLQPPRYDLALLARSVMGAAAADAAAGPEAGRAEPARFISPRWFWALLGLSVVVLLGLIVRLVRS